MGSAKFNNREFHSIRLSPYLPINFANGGWTFSIWFNVIGVECCALTTLMRIGPFWVGQVGFINPCLTIAFRGGVSSLAWDNFNKLPYILNVWGGTTAGTWRHLTVTTNAAEGKNITFLAYLNGMVIGAPIVVDASISPYNIPYTDGLLGGDGSASAYYPVSSYIDDFQIYNRALSSSEVLKLSWANRLTDVCVPCYAGAYCPSQGSVLACPMHTKSVSGSLNKANCSTCPSDASNYAHEDNVSLCTGCLSGYIKTGTESCRSCTGGYACPNMTTETICLSNQYSDAASTQCYQCMVNSTSAPGTVGNMSCMCNAGFFKRTVTPKACAPSNPNNYCILPNTLHYSGENGSVRDAKITLYLGKGNFGALHPTKNPPTVLLNDRGSATFYEISHGGITFEIDLYSTKQIGNFYFYCQVVQY